MYLARFESESVRLCAGALGLANPAPAGRPKLAAVLAGFPDVDAALRISALGADQRRLILLSAPEAAQAALQACYAALLQALAGTAPQIPANAAQFDALAGLDLRHQIRVDHAGYRHRGAALGCDFKLYAALGAAAPGRLMIYQVNLRAHQPSTETERQVRKYGAWLDLEQPFTEPVRKMQRMLVERLREPGWLANEYLAVDDAELLSSRMRHMQTFFGETTGRIGFQHMPVESGDFIDAMLTGLHTARDPAAPAALAVSGAELFSAHEVDWLAYGGVLGAQASGAGATPIGDQAGVFISYSSNDYRHAAAVCTYLESHDLRCWIAPRDIDRDVLPYTQAIERGIARARAVVLMLSEGANLSVHIPRELDLALERKLPIIPMRLQDVQPSGQLNYLLRTCQWLNAYEEAWPQACLQLLGRLERVA